MVAHLSEEEQIEALKRWWKDNGKSTVAAIVVAGAGYLGWSQYQAHEEAQIEQSSALFEQFVAASTELQSLPDADESLKTQRATVEALAADLNQQHSGSHYAEFSQLMLAKFAAENGDLEKAKSALSDVASNSTSVALKELAQLRLARIEMAAGNFDAALGILNAEATEAYASAFAELRGDIFLVQKQYEQARNAYEQALQTIQDPRSMRLSLVQLKLENTKVAEDSSVAPELEAIDPESSDSAAEDA